MTEGRLRYVQRVTDLRGNARYYFRVKGKHYPLIGPPGSPVFSKNYNALLALHYSGKLEKKSRLLRSRPARNTACLKFDASVPGTIGWVIIEYLKSRQFADLALTTKNRYRAELDAMRLSIGKRILIRLDTDDINLYCARIARERGTAIADLHLRLISSLWKFSKGFPECRRKGLSNPTYDAEKHYKVRLPHEPWPLAVQDRFLLAANPSLRLAFHLLLFTGQRRSDVVAMKWSDFDGRKISVTQGKTGEHVSVHVHKRLREVLANVPRIRAQILTNELGRPYTPDGLTSAVKRTLRTIGAPGYKLHGLRKSAAVALAEAGRSEFEIMAVLGQRTSRMAVYYCREANKSRLNESAIKGWEERDPDCV